MKRILTILLIAIFIFTLTACDEADNQVGGVEGVIETASPIISANQPTIPSKGINNLDLVVNDAASVSIIDTDAVSEPLPTDNAGTDDNVSNEVVAMISGSKVNMRVEPHTGARILKVLSDQQEILLLSSENGWGHVIVNDVYGYVFMDYVKTDEKNTSTDTAASAPVDEPQEPVTPSNIAWIGESKVNLRSEPSREAEILAVLTLGQEITLYGNTGEWKQVSANGKDGYVFAEYVVTETIAQAESSAQTKIPVYNQSAGSFTIAVDAGHQAKGNNELEPIGPGASQSKAKVASGTQGVSTRVPEYKLTLEVSLKLRDELLARGYNVFMIRESNDVNISNKERAVMAAEAGADILVRIHADGSTNSSVNGILTLCPTSRNPYVSDLYSQSRSLSDEILSAMVAATGAKNRGVSEVDNMSGINWSTVPVTIVEMGLMTNPTEDQVMQTADYQQKLVIGIADGIELYFSAQGE